MEAAKLTPVDLEAWAISMMERHNRKSHLVTQMSPATKTLLRETSSPASSVTIDDPTPTTIEIPIAADINGSAKLCARPDYPTRTSSASAVPSTMSLPIRPAPTGPLPSLPSKAEQVETGRLRS